MKHLFIINPVAGGRKSNTDEVIMAISAFAETLEDLYEIYITKEPMDACRKIEEDAGKLDNAGTVELYVYACGGDGTLNECVNGAAGRDNVAVTHYPSGTGNDFIKTFLPGDIKKFRDLHALSKGPVKQLDVIECSYSGIESGSGIRYGIAICSVGIDARVGTDVHKYSNIPVIGGATGYVVSLVVNVVKGVTQRYKITAGGHVFDKKLTLACACNGRYYGGGFNPVPYALPDDGILDCLVVEPVSRLKVAQIVGRYSKGRFAEFPDIFHHVRCTEMEIEADREFVVNVDGEGIYAKKICFKLIPKGINFIFPNGL